MASVCFTLNSIDFVWQVSLFPELVPAGGVTVASVLQNQFISLLLTIQNKRRQYNVEKKKKNKNGLTLDAKVRAICRCLSSGN